MAKPVATPVSVFAEWSLIGRVGFGCFLLALFLAPLIGGFPPGTQYGSDVALNALRALVLVAAGCLLVSPLPIVKEADVPRSPLRSVAVAAMWAAFAWTLLSLLVHSRFFSSPVLLFAMLPATIDWLVYALAFWVGARVLSHRAFLPYVAVAVVASAGIAALMLVREYGQFAQMGMKAQRAQSPFFSPNFAAGFLALTLPLVVAFFIAQKERLAVLGTGVVAALMLGALAATGSRAGVALAVLGTGVAFLLTLIAQKDGLRKFPWGRAALLVLVFGVMAFGFRGPLTARVEGGAASSQEHSGDFRKETAKSAVGMAQANPLFGTGPGTFPYRYAPYARAARTDLAHQSYIQLASEQGFPALAAVCAALILLSVASLPLARLRQSDEETDGLPRLLLCGLMGGVLAGAARSLFDSEWSLLGNGIPFWTLTGLLIGCDMMPSVVKSADLRNPQKKPALHYVAAIALVVPLVFCVMLLQTASTRDALTANRQAITPADIPSSWPPDPQLLYLAGKTEEAAQVEPSGRRWYQVGLSLSRQPGQEMQAAQAFQKSVEADPTNLQAWRRLAEAREKAGDAPGALQAWQELATRYEGPVGQIRAIPELTELYPAFAYAALARAAKGAGKNTEAVSLYEKAANVIERYSQTTPTYQQVEVQAAQSNGVDLAARRQEARDLYNDVMESLSGLTAGAADKNKLMERKTDTLARFDALLKPVGNDAPNSSP